LAYVLFGIHPKSFFFSNGPLGGHKNIIQHSLARHNPYFMKEVDCKYGFKPDCVMRPLSGGKGTAVQGVSGDDTLRLGINNSIEDSIVSNIGKQDRGHMDDSVVGCGQANTCGCQQESRSHDPRQLAVGLNSNTLKDDSAGTLDKCSECLTGGLGSLDKCSEGLVTTLEGMEANSDVIIGDTRTDLKKASTQTHELVAAFVEGIYKPDDTLVDDDEIDDIATDVFQPWIQGHVDADSVDILEQITIEGDAELQSKLWDLVREFRDVFANVLPPEPAIIPPFHLDVDTDEWFTNKNRGPPRVQSAANEKEIYKQLTPLLEAGIIRHSAASHYSQILLKKKKDYDAKRLCIDFRKLNRCTKTTKHPFPDIKGSLRE
jgi:hypothetical protein